MYCSSLFSYTIKNTLIIFGIPPLPWDMKVNFKILHDALACSLQSSST